MNVKNSRFHNYPKTKKCKAQDLMGKFLFIPRSMTYTCNYGTSSSSFKYTLKNVLNHHFIASELMFFFFRHYSLLFPHMSQRFRICDLKQPEGSDFTGSFLGD